MNPGPIGELGFQKLNIESKEIEIQFSVPGPILIRAYHDLI
jgi:hypothetical protein